MSFLVFISYTTIDWSCWTF